MNISMRELIEGACWRDEKILKLIYHSQGGCSGTERKGNDGRDSMLI